LNDKTTPRNLAAFREAAKDLKGIDLECYRQWDADPLTPVLGLGPKEAPLCFFGRDPGNREIEWRTPFVGAGGQKIRRALQPWLPPITEKEPRPLTLALGAPFFWANTVPYKPQGNKAWPTSIKRRFWPLIAEVLLTQWDGKAIITLGREAFFWFALNESAPVKHVLETFWQSPERFSQTLPWRLVHQDLEREVMLYPLPHPSPLNATYAPLFPSLLEQRLGQILGPKRIFDSTFP
jgi:uracil-DNA glycosylase